MKAYLKQVRISPKKVNVVASLVRGKNVNEALNILKFTPKRSAPVLAKLIASAAANAENNFQQDRNKLIVSKIIVNEGATMKRGQPISRGRWHPIKKRTAKIWVELSLDIHELVNNITEEEIDEEIAKVKEMKNENSESKEKINENKKVEEKVAKEQKEDEDKKIEEKEDSDIQENSDNSKKEVAENEDEKVS
jgi:large subunit ribosomal protein L22